MERRKFLGGLLVLSTGMLAGAELSYGTPQANAQETRVYAPTPLQLDIENRRQVKFLHPSDELNRLLFPDRACRSYLTETRTGVWEDRILEFIETVFAKLPESHYVPADDEEGLRHYLEFVLTERPLMDFSRLGLYANGTHASHRMLDGGRHIIKLPLSRAKLTEETKDQTEKTLIHEMTHYKTSQKLDYYRRLICDPVGLVDIDTLRRKFDAALKTVDEDELDDCGNVIGRTYNKLKHKNKLGYGATKFTEFFSVSAEYYSKGRQDFLTSYRRFLGSGRAKLFYSLVKEHLFDGIEYPA